MCIILMKPSGVSLPSKQLLLRCWNNNPNGSGVSIAENGNVYTHKGFMTFESFYDFLIKIGADKEKEKAMLLHFRITSVGKTSPEQTHPFPIYKAMKSEDVQKLSFNSKVVFAHNGTMGIKTRKDMSDTQTFAIDYLSVLYRLSGDVFNTDVLELCESIADSKLCLMNAKGEYRLVGEFIEKDGCFYSNSGYESVAYYTSSWNSSWNEDKYQRLLGNPIAKPNKSSNYKDKELRILRNILNSTVKLGLPVGIESKDYKNIQKVEEFIYDK